MPKTPDDTEDRTPDLPHENGVDAVIDYVHTNPIRALLGAVAFGFVIGRLLF